MTQAALSPPALRLAWTVGFVSAAVLGFEIALMRLLLVASWHHFAFLVISVVLLGFGASGTALVVLRGLALRRSEPLLFGLALLTAASMPLCWTMAQHVPLEARFAPALFWQQLALWCLYWAVLTVPFLFGAAVIGLALMVAGQRIAIVYGSNLIGSAAGSVGAVLAMTLVPPEWLPWAMGVPALIGAAMVWPARRRAGMAAMAATVIAVATGLLLEPPRVRTDQYKYGAHVQTLVAQGSAERLARVYGPRAQIEAYHGHALHDFPFLGPGIAPPLLSVIVIDGHWGGSVPNIASADEARFVDQTLMAFPYLAAGRPRRVALLGERGGTNIWLAARRGAGAIDVVQPDANLFDLIRESLSGGTVLDMPVVQTIVAEPRHFIEHAADRYDVIQLVMLESSAAGSGGVGGLAQDDLITVEGISACLRQLTGDGLLFVCRGIQTPPRDNIKLLATFVAALERNGVANPGDHLVIVRDFLAVCTVVKASAWSPGELARVRAVCAERQLTPVWFRGIQPGELNYPDVLDEGPDGIGDWYHYAATQLLSPARDRFIDDWMFDVRPPTDDRPFFLDFSRLKSIPAAREAFGDLWLTRSELAFLFVLAAAAVITVVGAILTLLPLVFLRRGGGTGGRGATFVYFAAIGLAYLLLEITCLSRMTHLIGDPVWAAAVTIGGFLLFSGAGSLSAQRLDPQQTRLARFLIGGLVIVAVAALFGFPFAAALGGGLPMLLRCALALVLIAPLGYLMGFPMPIALARLQGGAPALIPWAWAINGCASVLAPPLAIAMGMTWGFTVAGLSAIALYGAVVAVIGGVGARRGTGDEGRGIAQGEAATAA